MKKSKKFVLAGLVLLAITGLLALAGCKNDSVPETPAAKLVSITVTPPTRTVYSVGQSFDPTGMVVTATYDDGEERTVTGTITTDTSTLTQSAGVQTVTVSYTDEETSKTTTFTVTVFPEEVKVLTDYESPNNTDDNWTYVAFGEWPQTILKGDVEVDESEGKKIGMFTYYLGDDGNHYVKAEENAYKAGYKYSDDSEVKQKDESESSSPSTRWFKVEPIVWRVLTTNYEVPEGGTGGEVLLLAEKILTSGIKWADSKNDYMESNIRQWLNGNSVTGETSDYSGTPGFLQTAFTQSDWELIADTTVDNSPGKGTTDKVFLLSEEEATTSVYGFAAEGIKDSTRIRDTTDYAKATGAEQSSSGGWWWLRSPHSYHGDFVRVIKRDGDDTSHYNYVRTDGGVVPALSISLQ